MTTTALTAPEPSSAVAYVNNGTALKCSVQVEHEYERFYTHGQARKPDPAWSHIDTKGHFSCIRRRHDHDADPPGEDDPSSLQRRVRQLGL